MEIDLVAAAREILAATAYMTLGTADSSGAPWVSPVWFASPDAREFFWVSDPEARHSRNIAARAQISIAIFDSQVPIGTGRALFMSATASQVDDDQVDRGMEIFSQVSLEQGGREWTRADVEPPARLRLYRAIASEHWVGINDRRSLVSLAG